MGRYYVNRDIIVRIDIARYFNAQSLYRLPQFRPVRPVASDAPLHSSMRSVDDPTQFHACSLE